MFGCGSWLQSIRLLFHTTHETQVYPNRMLVFPTWPTPEQISPIVRIDEVSLCRSFSDGSELQRHWGKKEAEGLFFHT